MMLLNGGKLQMDEIFITKDEQKLITHDEMSLNVSIKKEETHMANRFNFRILNGSDPQAQYAAITTKDALTFYLLADGTGYLGEVPLFGGDAEKFNLITTAGAATLEAGKVYIFAVDGVTVGGDAKPQGIYYSADGSTVENITYKTIAEYITENAIKAADVDETYAGNETTIMTSAAVVEYVNSMIADQNLMDIAFFNNVISYTLTQADIDDITNGTETSGGIKATYPGITGLDANCHKDDQGLIFVTDNLGEGTDDEKSYIFVNLCKLINVYDVTSDDDSVTITPTTTTDGHKTTFDISVNVPTTVATDIAANISAGADSIAEGSTYDVSALADNAFVSEKRLAEVLANILKDYVKYDIDSGT